MPIRSADIGSIGMRMQTEPTAHDRASANTPSLLRSLVGDADDAADDPPGERARVLAEIIHEHLDTGAAPDASIDAIE